MSTFLALRPGRRLASLAFVLPFSLFLFPPTQAQDPPPVIGSQNTVTADPPVTRPHEQPCIVQLFSGFQFVDFSNHIYQYAPPAACPVTICLPVGMWSAMKPTTAPCSRARSPAR